MAQIVPDVTVVSEIVNIVVAFRSSVWPLQTEFVSLSMNFYQDGRACVIWWVGMGLYTVVMEGSKIEFKVEEK